MSKPSKPRTIAKKDDISGNFFVETSPFRFSELKPGDTALLNLLMVQSPSGKTAIGVKAGKTSFGPYGLRKMADERAIDFVVNCDGIMQGVGNDAMEKRSKRQAKIAELLGAMEKPFKGKPYTIVTGSQNTLIAIEKTCRALQSLKPNMAMPAVGVVIDAAQLDGLKPESGLARMIKERLLFVRAPKAADNRAVLAEMRTTCMAAEEQLGAKKAVGVFTLEQLAARL